MRHGHDGVVLLYKAAFCTGPCICLLPKFQRDSVTPIFVENPVCEEESAGCELPPQAHIHSSIGEGAVG